MGNMNLFGFLSKLINDRMVYAEVDKSVTIKTQTSGHHKPHIAYAAGFIQFKQVFFLVLINHYDTVKGRRS